MNFILTNRKQNIEGNWYAPRAFLEHYKSVFAVKLLNTTSSAGDWDGIFFQLINGIVYGIPFNQENNYPNSGFTLYTGEVFFSCEYSIWNGNIEEKIIEDYCEITYRM
jgi:hypothetical protein